MKDSTAMSIASFSSVSAEVVVNFLKTTAMHQNEREYAVLYRDRVLLSYRKVPNVLPVAKCLDSAVIFTMASESLDFSDRALNRIASIIMDATTYTTHSTWFVSFSMPVQGSVPQGFGLRVHSKTKAFV